MKVFMLKEYLKIYTLFFFLLGFSQGRASNTQKFPDNLIVDYFKEKIKDYEKSNFHAVPKGKKIKRKDLEESRQRVWSLWKKANEDLAELPAPEVVTGSKKKYATQLWHLHDEDPMPFYYISKGLPPKAGYPLFINLHGSGPKKHEFEATLRWGIVYKDAPSLYFIPQIPNEARYRWWFKPEQYAWEKLFRLAMINDNINADKIYMMGISEGGYGSQRLGAFYADYLAGAGPMAGGEPLENAPPLNYRNIAFSLQTGEHDHMFGRNKLTRRAGEVFDSLQKTDPQNFKHNIVIQPGKGHGIDYTQTTPWLIQYERNATPSHVSWVLFPMDGRYRDGFYNIGIDKRPNISDAAVIDRAFFDLQLDKATNSVHLEVWLEDGSGQKREEVKEGEVSVFLSPDMLNFSKKVKLYYNGKLIHNKKVRLDENVLIESCALFGDPKRLFPAKINVVL